MWIVLFAGAPRGSTVSPWEDPTIETAVDHAHDTASDTAAPVAACASTRSPSRWGLDVARSAVVRIEADFDPGTVHAGSLRVYGRVSGYLPGVVDVAGGVATFTHTVLPHPGERLTAVLTAEATCTSGEPAGPLLWAVSPSTRSMVLTSAFAQESSRTAGRHRYRGEQFAHYVAEHVHVEPVERRAHAVPRCR